VNRRTAIISAVFAGLVTAVSQAEPATDLDCVQCVSGREIEAESIGSSRIRQSAIKTRNIYPGAVTKKKIAPDAVDSEAIRSGAVDWPELSDDVTQTLRALEAYVQQSGECAQDAVRAGDACIDKYEASVWQTKDADAISKIRSGTITSADELTGVATQYGVKVDDYDPGCPDNAAGCVDFFAVSVAGVFPADTITWFQAAAACRNSGKRLATNQEWQMAAFGTPDTGVDDGVSSCRITGSSTGETGSRSNCISDAGAMDLVGNLWEWVADWWPAVINADGSGCNTGWASFSDDYNCGAINVSSTGPAAVLRGGDAFGAGGNTRAGPFAIALTRGPQAEWFNVGFRCAKDF
jgi:hypothetical protein